VTDDGTSAGGLWTSTGKAVVFSSTRDGYRCLWAQPLDPASKQPIGVPAAVHHEHTPVRSLAELGSADFVRDRLVFTMVERTGSIWMAEWQDR
jgi:eukaryotic-like serine/threonine-protein kinase